MRRHGRRAPRLCALILISAMTYGQGVSEYALKAAFLYNFAKFVQWPAEAFPSRSAPLLLCSYKSNEVGDALQHIVRGKTINGRSLAVKEIRDPGEGKTCQMLFVGADASPSEESILAAIGDESILIVGETPEFAKRGGGINFVVQEDRLRFVVNLSATDRARLKLSSKLLSLAILTGN